MTIKIRHRNYEYQYLDVLVSAWLAWLFLGSPLWSISPLLLLVCALMALLAVLPMLRWVRRGFTGFPVVETYSLAHVPAYLIPFLAGRAQTMQYPVEMQTKAAFIVCVFLLSVQLVYYWLVASVQQGSGLRWPFLLRSLPDVRESYLIWVLLGLWWLFTGAVQLQLLPDVGQAFNVFNTIFTTSGALAIVCLFVNFGRGHIGTDQKFTLFVVLLSGVVLQFTSGFLVGGTALLLLSILAYTMGRKRFPVIAVTVCFVVISFLHAGKAEMRTRYWGEEKNYAQTRLNPLEVYAFWFNASWNNFFDSVAEADQPQQSLLRRSEVAPMLTLVVAATPETLPFLQGHTYLQTPQLFIPRVFWPNKPRGSLPTETLAIYYGMQTEKSANVTAIGLGQIAEAWGNFGWLGVVIVGGLYGLIYSLPAAISRNSAPNQIGFLIAALFLSRAYHLEECLGPWLVSLVQALLVAAGGLYLLLRPTHTLQKSGLAVARGIRSTRYRRTQGLKSPQAN